jgi:hypothetical protein
MIAVVLPFETVRPLLVTPWFSLTDDRLVLLAAALAWVLAGVQALPTRREWRTLAPSLALVLVAVVAALQAPDFKDDALKSASRLVAAAFVLLLVLRVGRDPVWLAALLWAIVAAAGASAVVGIGEALSWRALDPFLGLFKIAPTRVGGELRVSASFQYATIAAMYFEMVTPLAIVLAATATRRWQRLLAIGIAALCAANVVLSLTRAGLLTLAVIGVALLVGAGLRRDWRRILAPTLAVLGVLIGGVALLAVHNPVFDLRLATESDADWYGAEYAAPASLELTADHAATVDLDVRNMGRIAWSSFKQDKHPFALGYRWLTADGQDALDVPPGEVALANDVEPGETIHLQPLVNVPSLPAGTYRLDWGMLQRGVLKFYERGWADAETVVRVNAAPNTTDVAMPATLPRDDDEAPWVVGRLSLWGAAARMIQARPLLGVGLDNFRHFYGAELGLDSWDERVAANNLYLELLADLGVLGLAAFLWVTVPSLLGAFRTLRGPDPRPGSLWLLGVALGLIAFLVHGVLDSFLSFTPTALLLWMLLGMAAALIETQKPHVSGR